MENQKSRAKRLKDYYNLTIEESDATAAHQGNVCWLCGRPEPTGKRLAHDHSHLDGLVRGRLCSQCNPFIGKIENAFVRLGLHKVAGLTLPALMERVAAYLRNPPAIAALGRAVYGYAGRTGTKVHRRFLRAQKRIVTPPRPLLPPRKRHK